MEGGGGGGVVGGDSAPPLPLPPLSHSCFYFFFILSSLFVLNFKSSVKPLLKVTYTSREQRFSGCFFACDFFPLIE